jgi:hypothetical protein
MTLLRNAIAAAALVVLAGSASAQRRPAATPEQLQAVDRAVAEFISPTLVRFDSDEAFSRYARAVWERERLGNRWGDSRAIQLAQVEQVTGAQSDSAEPICPDEDPQCLAPEADAQELVVTGSRIAPSNPSITNNQMRGVEEGDIVKQIDHYLLVLQDGRIFVIDTRAGDRRRLAVTDRMDVYRDPHADMWYDEMLVFGDRVLITGYSYREDATELSVFRLDDAGRLSRDGVFYITSDDYYDTSNYATRLIGDSLVIYTPFDLDNLDDGDDWPVVRRWMPEEAPDESRRRRGGRDLFDAAQIYRPVRDVEDPVVHTVSVCPLGAAGADRDLECRTTAFVGPNDAQWYVSEEDAFLWTVSRDWDSFDYQSCDAFDLDQYEPALLYRVPIAGLAPQLVAARGLPPDQFSLHSSGGRFRALLKDRPHYCGEESTSEANLSFFDIPLSSFSDTVRDVPLDRYTRLPGVKSHYIANRFTDRYLVYGSLGRYRRGLSENAMPPAYVVPVDRPAAVRPMPVRHTVIRAEQAGNDIVVTGYRDGNGLVVTLIDLDGRPRIGSSVALDRRFESEGRSHAFNSLIEEDGHGIMGLPTIGGEGWSSRAAWRSSASDLSYLTVDRRGQLEHVGELVRRFAYDEDDDGDDGIPGYACEVSCIDWYGNSRPIFTDGRIFGLSGAELIEGRITNAGILEVQRLNIALGSMRLATAQAAEAR